MFLVGPVPGSEACSIPWALIPAQFVWFASLYTRGMGTADAGKAEVTVSDK